MKFAGIFQPVPKVQGGNAVFPDDLEVSVIVAPRNSVIHVLALRDDNKIATRFKLELFKSGIFAKSGMKRANKSQEQILGATKTCL